MNKSNLTNWLSALCAGLLIVVLVLQSKQGGELQSLRQGHESFVTATGHRQQETREAVSTLSERVTALGTNLDSRLAQGDKQAKERMVEAMNVLQQQTAVLHRAVGKVIPVELPESLTKKLVALERRVTDEKSWPKDGPGVDMMVVEMRDLTRQIPPWAEDDLLPRLNAVRWGVSALTLVTRAQPVASDALGEFLDDVDTAIEAKPDGASALLLKHLTELQSTLKQKFDMARRSSAIADAERFRTEGATPAEISDVLERLTEWAGAAEFKERVQKLQHELRARVLADETSRFIASVDASFRRAREEPNQTIRQISLYGLLGSVLSHRQGLFENQEAAKSLSDSLTERAKLIEQAIESEGKAQAAEQDKKIREYQRWALSQIESFNTAVSVDEKGVRGLFTNSADYPAIKDDMVQFLVPISVPHLDPAVSRLYSGAFERGWKLLDGAGQKYLQTGVAEQEAVVRKRKP